MNLLNREDLAWIRRIERLRVSSMFREIRRRFGEGVATRIIARMHNGLCLESAIWADRKYYKSPQR